MKKKDLNEMSNEELWQLFPIILSPHNPEWPGRYETEKELLIKTIGTENIIRINHIGSTAVPGLTAKPTIDILLEIQQKTDPVRLIPTIESAGYIYCHKPDNPPPHMMFMKGYTPEGFKAQAFHLHIRYSGDWDEPYFRDYLLAHPDTAKVYGELKVKLQKLYEHDRDGYTDAKTDFIREITNRAKEQITYPTNME